MRVPIFLFMVCAAFFCTQPAYSQKAAVEKNSTAAKAAAKGAQASKQTQVPVPATEPRIDFDDLMSSDAGSDRRTIYADGAANQINSEVEGHGERHNTSLERKRASASSGSSGSSGGASSSSSAASTPRSAGSKTFVCSYKCTNASFTNSERTAMSVRVTASDASSARDEAVKHARSACYEQTRRVYDTGTASCREQ